MSKLTVEPNEIWKEIFPEEKIQVFHREIVFKRKFKVYSRWAYVNLLQKTSIHRQSLILDRIQSMEFSINLEV